MSNLCFINDINFKARLYRYCVETHTNKHTHHGKGTIKYLFYKDFVDIFQKNKIKFLQNGKEK